MGVVEESRGVTALYHCFLDKITVIPLLFEGFDGRCSSVEERWSAAFSWPALDLQLMGNHLYG